MEFRRVLFRSILGDAILKEDESKQLSKSLARDAAERQARLEAADPVPAQIFVVSKAFRRNQDVVAEVLKQAKGHCQDCHLPAPFLRARDGTPFLEVHHLVTLAEGGLDTVDNAIALCPRSEEHTSELQTLMPISYDVFSLKKNNRQTTHPNTSELTN